MLQPQPTMRGVMSATWKEGGRCGQAAHGWLGGVCEQHNMTLDHGHCLTQVSPSGCRWAGAPRGLGKLLWLRPPGARRARLVVMVMGGAAAVRRAVLGLISHAARSLPALPGSSRKTGVLVAEKIDSEENPCCPLVAAGTDER